MEARKIRDKDHERSEWRLHRIHIYRPNRHKESSDIQNFEVLKTCVTTVSNQHYWRRSFCITLNDKGWASTTMASINLFFHFISSYSRILSLKRVIRTDRGVVTNPTSQICTKSIISEFISFFFCMHVN